MKKILLAIAILSLAASVQAAEVTLRLGQGGFTDNRAPDGRVGGGQLCMDIKFNDLPLAASVGLEYYTKSAEPTDPYEIPGFLMGYIFYVIPLAEKWPTDLYLGGGIGRIRIPQGEKAVAFQAIARIGTKVFWKIGIYAEGKYINSKKNLIDFNEAALLIGISLNFAW
jgi:hypothetical protein